MSNRTPPKKKHPSQCPTTRNSSTSSDTSGGGVWQLPGYTEGFFEVQDEGSQLLALATEASSGEVVLVSWSRR